MRAIFLILLVILSSGCIGDLIWIGLKIGQMNIPRPSDIFDFNFFDPVTIAATQTDVEKQIVFLGIRYKTTIDCKVRNRSNQDQKALVTAGVDVPGKHPTQTKTVMLSPKEEKWTSFVFQDINGNEGRMYCRAEAISS